MYRYNMLGVVAFCSVEGRVYAYRGFTVKVMCLTASLDTTAVSSNLVCEKL